MANIFRQVTIHSDVFVTSCCSTFAVNSVRICTVEIGARIAECTRADGKCAKKTGCCSALCCATETWCGVWNKTVGLTATYFTGVFGKKAVYSVVGVAGSGSASAVVGVG